MGEFIGSIFWLLVTLGVLVTFHEFGHYWVGRLLGVKAVRFSVGYGKPIWSRTDRHGTEFAIAPIPLGGYVKFLDEREDAVANDEIHLAFNRKAVWKRALIFLAGPGFNFILAVALYCLMFVIGKPELHPAMGHSDALFAVAGVQYKDRLERIDGHDIDTWNDVTLALVKPALERRDVSLVVRGEDGAQRELILPLSQLPAAFDEARMFELMGMQPWQPAATLGAVSADSPASRAGLQSGDRVRSINGEAVRDWRDLVRIIAASGEGNLTFLVARDGEESLHLVQGRMPSADDPDKAIIGIGQQFTEEDKAYYRGLQYRLQYGPVEALSEGFRQTGRMVMLSIDMIGKLLTGQASLKNLSGPITIAQVANDSAGTGVAGFLAFLALISLSLGLVNLLPIPILDGGHLVLLLMEKIKGGPLSENFLIKVQAIGLILLFSLMSLAFYNDILRTVS